MVRSDKWYLLVIQCVGIYIVLWSNTTFWSFEKTYTSALYKKDIWWNSKNNSIFNQILIFQILNNQITAKYTRKLFSHPIVYWSKAQKVLMKIFFPNPKPNVGNQLQWSWRTCLRNHLTTSHMKVKAYEVMKLEVTLVEW